MIAFFLLLLLVLPASAQVVTYSPGKVATVTAQSGAVVTNTGIGTSEVSMVAVPLPPLGANDAVRITTLWDTTGSNATNSKQLVVRLSATACPTPLVACNTGTAVLSTNMNAAGSVSDTHIAVIRNANATNAQVFHAAGSAFGIGNTSGATGTAAVQTNTGSFLNINSQTTTASTDTIKLLGYTVELIPAL